MSDKKITPNKSVQLGSMSIPIAFQRSKGSSSATAGVDGQPLGIPNQSAFGMLFSGLNVSKAPTPGSSSFGVPGVLPNPLPGNPLLAADALPPPPPLRMRHVASSVQQQPQPVTSLTSKQQQQAEALRISMSTPGPNRTGSTPSTPSPIKLSTEDFPSLSATKKAPTVPAAKPKPQENSTKMYVAIMNWVLLRGIG